MHVAGILRFFSVAAWTSIRSNNILFLDALLGFHIFVRTQK
jgi:uncharacterized membrane protein